MHVESYSCSGIEHALERQANPNNNVYNLRSSEKWNQIEHNQKRINANQFSLANDKW